MNLILHDTYITIKIHTLRIMHVARNSSACSVLQLHLAAFLSSELGTALSTCMRDRCCTACLRPISRLGSYAWLAVMPSCMSSCALQEQHFSCSHHTHTHTHGPSLTTHTLVCWYRVLLMHENSCSVAQSWLFHVLHW